MNYFDTNVVRDLEFDTVREWLHGYCVGPTAQLRMAELVPERDFVLLKTQLLQLDEFCRLRREGISFPAIDFEELETEITMLQLKDSVLLEESFARLHRANTLVNEMRKAFEGMETGLPHLFQLFQEVYITEEIAKAIDIVFDAKWKVRDEASEELHRIRKEIAQVRREIAKNFAKVMKDYAGKGFLGDTGEAFINERRVLAIYSTHKRKVPGIALGQSKTGALSYIEPEVNVALNFELESLFDDERREIRKILQVLTHQIRQHLPLIRLYQQVLTELDFIQAKARLALELDALLPELEEESCIDLKNAYHPILWVNNKRAGKKTFPQSVVMDKFSRMLVISGPNAGGKSITMKTIGLLQVMLQSGLLVPVAAGSKMSFFHAVLTDIGDNQSIENQLSTYSYRLKRMRHFLEVANKRSLILLDEFGTGSDPDLGGALAEVFFEELYNKKSFGVITTHYGNIKLKAAQLRNAVNGCMLFNTETLEPTYRLSVGQPGSSFTFEVAQINGIPADLIAKAKSKLSESKVLMDAMLASLQEEKLSYEDLSKQAGEAAKTASATITDFEKKKQRYEEKLQKQSETIERNNKYLNHGKKTAQFIEQYQLKAKNKELLEEIKKYIVLEKTKQEEDRLQRSIAKKLTQKSGQREKKVTDVERIQVGSLVRLHQSKQTGTVLEISGAEATVAFGNFKTKVEKRKLEFIQ